MKIISVLKAQSAVVSPGAPQRIGEHAVSKLRSLMLTPAAAVSLITLAAACGSYSSPAGTSGESAGATSAPAGAPGTSGAGGGATTGPVAGAPSTQGGATNGGASDMPNGGAAPIAGAGGSDVTGGAAPVAGAGGAGGGSASGGSAGGGSAGAPNTIALPCDVLKNGGNTCVAAHSTVRVIVPGYAGPLYQLCKGSAVAGPQSCKGTTQDVASNGGYADAASQDTFCSGASCTITKIYDQSGQKNDLEPAPKGGAKGTPDNPAKANALKVTVDGHSAYGVRIATGIGYRSGCSGCTVKTGNGMVKGDNPETMYWVTGIDPLIDKDAGCCFDYGNAERSSNDDGNGTMEALYFGAGVVWGTGAGGKPGPWMMADLEDGLYAGWENKQDKNISTNKKLPSALVTGVLIGDTSDKNAGKGRFAIYAGDATTGTLQTMYDGIRPEKAGYVPMSKDGSIILGIGGDNSNGAGGQFYEGAISTGPAISKTTVDELQAAIVAAKYVK